MIYLDHAAATPVDKRVLEAMIPYFSEEFFNPSAAYLPAKAVREKYEEAKGAIAHAIGAKAADLVITAGATEANNLAFSVASARTRQSFWLGAFRSAAARELAPAARGRLPEEASERRACSSFRSDDEQTTLVDGPAGRGDEQNDCRVLYLATEHDSVRKVAEQYGGEAIKVDRDGRVAMDDLRAKITDNTQLISIALVNNELGTIQPLSEVAALVREVRFDRLRRGVRTPLYLHSDASQALNLLDVNVARLGVDLLTLNAATIYGPKGVGALYVAHDVKLAPVNYGGGQEKGLRSGTENVPGVVGFAKAIELSHEHLNGNRKKYAKWRKILTEGLTDCEIINRRHSLDNFVNLCYNGLDGERLLYLLEERGIYVATGAACAASKGIKSHVLAAIGLSDSEIAGSLRLTLGETNTDEQIHEAVRIINEVAQGEYRRVSR